MLRLSLYVRRQWLSLILLLVLIGLLANGLMGHPGPRDLMVLRARGAEFEAQRARLAARNADLRTNVQNLRSDNRFLERLIRQELGYARSDELVYKFAADNSTAKPGK